MIRVRTLEHGELVEVTDPERISDIVEAQSAIVWVDLEHATDHELELVASEFVLHPLAMEDARRHGQRPKLEQYPTHAFVVAYSSRLAEVDLFIGDRWLVTIRGDAPDGRPWDTTQAAARLVRTCPDPPSVGFALYTILDELVDGYFDATTEVDNEIELLENEVFSGVAGDEHDVQERMFAIRRRLLVFRRSVVPLREVLAALLRREVSWVDEMTLVHLQDVYDHVLRAVDMLDSQRELMGNAVEAHLAIISNQMNRVMKRMTSWGAILLGSTLVAGIYGMNFRHMPELQSRFGYPFALGLMALITIGGYAWFRHKDWL